MAKSYESRVRGLGAAGEGLGHWSAQRLTAIALIPLLLVSLILLIKLSGLDYAATRSFMGQPWVAGWFGLSIVVALYHAALGLQVVIEDYVSSHGAKILFLIAVRFACLLVGALALISLISLV